MHILNIEYSNPLLDIYMLDVGGPLHIGVNPAVCEWCSKMGIQIRHCWRWHNTAETKLLPGPGHYEIEFKTQSEMNWFSLKWL